MKPNSPKQTVNSIVIDTNSAKIISDRSSNGEEVSQIQSESSVCLSPNDLGKIYNEGRWSDYEHLIFLAWIIHFGRDWKKIEDHVQTRSSAQARSHAQKVLK